MDSFSLHVCKNDHDFVNLEQLMDIIRNCNGESLVVRKFETKLLFQGNGYEMCVNKFKIIAINADNEYDKDDTIAHTLTFDVEILNNRVKIILMFDKQYKYLGTTIEGGFGGATLSELYIEFVIISILQNKKPEKEIIVID